MDLIWQKFTEWLKELLVSGIMDNVNGLFDNVNSRVAGIAGQVGATPQGWNSGVYGMIRTLSDYVILPIAGVILAFVMTLELIQLITEKNNMHDVDSSHSPSSDQTSISASAASNPAICSLNVRDVSDMMMPDALLTTL